MRERDLHVGLRLRLCCWGREDAPRTLLVLHGYLEQGAAWDAVARALVAADPDLRVLAPDQRGHGLSDHIGPGGAYHFWDYVADVQRLLDALGLEVVDVLGHSMGGAVASLFAGARPDQVRRLVLVEGLGPADTTALSVERGRMFLDDVRRDRQHRPMADAAEATARMQRANPHLPAAVASALAVRTVRPVDPADPAAGVVWTWDVRHRHRFPYPFSESAFRSFLARVTAPTLTVYGGRSVFLVDEHRAREASLARVETAVVPQAGHLAHHDRPEALASVISAHLAG
jgi:pimeloyl-ACP methyl ester carboxylesterase